MDISKLIGLDVLNNILKKVYSRITDETSIKIDLNTKAIESNTNRINENKLAIEQTNKKLIATTNNLSHTITSNYSELNSKIEANDAKIKENADKMATREDLDNTAAQIREQISTEISGIIADAPESFDTLKEISDWISTHEGSAATMNSSIAANTKAIEEINSKLSNIEIGSSIFKSLFDIVRPIGDIYVQYPQQANPNELWGVYSTWSIVNYDGAFFRAEGTNANAFIEKTGNLIKQGELVGSHSDSITVSGGNHTHPYSYGRNYNSHYNNTYKLYDTATHNNYTGYAGYSGNLSMSGTVTHTSTENRPTNYTIRVWKRTA